MRHPADVVWHSPPSPELAANDAHVWRIPLDESSADLYWPLLSADERVRANRFHGDALRRRYTVAHGAMRAILSQYVGAAAESLSYTFGTHGKPALVVPGDQPTHRIEFNLSHSDDLALLAVARDRAVGVDLERLSDDVEHLALAERFFSVAERETLQALAEMSDQLTTGFFAAWSRKEAYLKATGHGITRGLHHFDVSLAPDDVARLVADRLDQSATDRWVLRSLPVDPRFAAAVCVAAPCDEVHLFDGSAFQAELAREAPKLGSR